jgi:uncharacterized protein YjlB
MRQGRAAAGELVSWAGVWSCDASQYSQSHSVGHELVGILASLLFSRSLFII